MLPDAVMIADDTSGPMNADVLPTTEKSAKNRNLRAVSTHCSVRGRKLEERKGGRMEGGRGRGTVVLVVTMTRRMTEMEMGEGKCENAIV